MESNIGSIRVIAPSVAEQPKLTTDLIISFLSINQLPLLPFLRGRGGGLVKKYTFMIYFVIDLGGF